MSVSIQAKAGRQFTIKVSDGAATPTFLTIGGLRDTSMQLNGGAVDITNVASNGWREYLPGGGVKELSVSGSGIFDSLTPGARKVWDAAMAQDASGYLEMQLISGHGDSFVGTFVVDSYSRKGGNEAETFDISLKSSGPPTYIPAP
ncbi:phage tail tube protein [Azospirillum canadense]|uniref:phage tail tube protein n=1 Tax=Azospirillum canadense TaxID=403962 RepID=UPI002225E583|nr:phage tail protein [Azospirillum canadense]MCW2242261.1 TP901-1 family phage major tail protein [Azospirillum canadense]